MSRHVRWIMMFALLVAAPAARAQLPTAAAPRGGPQSAQRGVLAAPPTGAAVPAPAAQGFDRNVRQAAHATPSRAAAEPLPLPLPPRRAATGERSRGAARAKSNRAVTTVGGSLAVVLAAFFALAWLSRRATPAGLAPLPGEVVESLGRAPLISRQQMQLVRVGKKLLLLCVSQSGVETLTEITEAEEVDRLTGLCRENQPGSVSDTFRQVLAQYGREGQGRDAAAAPPPPAARSSRRSRVAEVHDG